jgi:hypothetical protein
VKRRTVAQILVALRDHSARARRARFMRGDEQLAEKYARLAAAAYLTLQLEIAAAAAKTGEQKKIRSLQLVPGGGR